MTGYHLIVGNGVLVTDDGLFGADLGAPLAASTSRAATIGKG